MAQTTDWVERLARFGYAAKGIVYGIVGVLAVQAAVSAGGQTTDTQGALNTIAAQPFGQILLALVAIGLIEYVLWRVVQAIYDPEGKGKDAKGIAQRLGYLLNGAVYTGLALSALKLTMGGSAGSSNGQQDATAQLLAQPFGQWLVGLIGAGVIGIGFYQFYEAYKASFRKRLNLNQMSDTERTWATRVGRFGLAARGLVLTLTGLFLIQAARQSDPNQVQGLDGALQTLAQQPQGAWLLGLVALGLVAYGIHMLVQARYGKINAPAIDNPIDPLARSR
ncbi:DUF1206 domain-containing protein [Microcoleus sp. FACHB-1515]|uniref:DUF1206 domain-containing protein n=1 Tax=Cyanophyceae TaxID=3028117 RepID=UPI00168222F4|nr:DUF1206 domain-containing protein [Microcoleus sp. FACHB-1515]MBD2092748.1 DUF1206 domain-containing protein [Microcoleus sp. FACHB-1515]